jgi:hypothetical protein
MRQTRSTLISTLAALGNSAAFGYATLLALQLKVLWGVWQNWDLPLWDGASYFIYGRTVATAFVFPPLEWSPAYAGFYGVFHWLLGGWGNLAVYLVHRVTVLVIVVWLLYAVLRKVLPPAVAWLMSAGFIVLQVGLTNHFVVHLFILIPLLAAYRLALSTSPYGRPLAMASLVAAAFVRVEYVVAVVVVGVGLLLLDRRSGTPAARRRPGRVTWAALVLGGAAAVVMVARAGPSHAAVDRSWGAFGQHYAWGYQERHPEWNVNFWFNYTEAVQRSFGDAQSITQAALNNPGEMLTHILWNVGVAPRVGPELFATLPGMEWSLLILIAGAVGLLIGAAQALSHRKWSASPQAVTLALVIAGTLIPLVISSLLIRPRAIYLMPVLPVILLLAGLGLTNLLPATLTRRQLAAALPLLAAGGILWLPSPYAGQADRPVLQIAQVLKALPVEGDFALLGPSARGLCAYSRPAHCQGIEIFQVPKDVTQFADYLAAENVKVIVVNDQVLSNLPEAGRAFAAGLVATPSPPGWQSIAQIGPFWIFLRSTPAP